MKLKYEKMMGDLQDRVKVLKLAQDRTSGELKQSRTELAAEKRKYDRFLERDRERLVYAQNMLKTRRLVHLSYANEVKRRRDKAALGGAKAEEVSEAMAQARAELRRMEELATKGTRKKATSNEPVKRKSQSKMRVTQPYQSVKSRLYKSIESSRQKETRKYEYADKLKFLEYREQYSQKKDQSQRS